MTLWNIIRDWFVVNIWGGFDSAQVYHSDNIVGEVFDTTSYKVLEYDGDTLSLADWLSTTSTIIVLVILCIIFGLMVRWLFRLTSGLLQGR